MAEKGEQLMVKYYCDKCNLQLETYNIFTIKITPPDFRRWDDEALTEDRILCRGCMELFDGWISITRKMNEADE